MAHSHFTVRQQKNVDEQGAKPCSGIATSLSANSLDYLIKETTGFGASDQKRDITGPK